MMMNDLSNSLITSLRELAGDQAELILDATLTNETLQKIPVFGTLFKLTDIYHSVTGLIFEQKLRRYLYSLAQVPIFEREMFLKALEEDPDFRKKVGEKIIIMLDRADDIQKADLIANATKALIRQDIDYRTFELLVSSIDKFPLSYLDDLEKFYTADIADFGSQFYNLLLSCNLMSFRTDGYRGARMWENFMKNDLGRKFYELIILNKKFDLKSYTKDQIMKLEILEKWNDQNSTSVRLSGEEVIKIIDNLPYNELAMGNKTVRGIGFSEKESILRIDANVFLLLTKTN